VYLLYSLLLTVGFILMTPRFLLDALRSGKYVTGLRQRLGSLPALRTSNHPLIWLHCVSVGETEAARPLVRALRERFPEYRLAVSTTTVTGQQVARRAFSDDATIFYFPIDWAWVIRRGLTRLQPAAVLIMETEVWPNLLRESRRRSIPVAIVNGRISQRSFSRYRMVRPFMRRVLGNVSMAIMQSQEDGNRIRELGMPPERTIVAGNLKFDNAETALTDTHAAAQLRDRFQLDSGELLLVAASTHSPEERIAIEAFRKIRQSNDTRKLRLLIAPRHPERFSEVAELIRGSGLKWARRSAAAVESDSSCDVILLDSVGELRAVFQFAGIAFIGGSIARHGGHNVLEPAAQGVCVITGPHTNNFNAVMRLLLDEDAIVQLPEVPESQSSGQLASALTELLTADERRRAIGNRAKAVTERHRGATEFTIKTISSLIDSHAQANHAIPFSAVELTPAK
jgi:3-deoxy-D-manno-octulosonic-acid transferase